MSAFLGPIHYWLYNKIQLQEALVHDILALAAKNDWLENPVAKLDSACGKLELLPLEDAIDGSNIHGWLHQKIALTESRLAFLVTKLLEEDAARLEALKQTAYAFGTQHALPQGTSAGAALKALEDTLLDGMPCDHVNRVLESGEDKVVWGKLQCVHCEYWQQVGGDVAVYNALRAEIITGILAESGLEFATTGKDKYQISRKG